MTDEQIAQLDPAQKAMLEFIVAYEAFTFQLSADHNIAPFALMCVADKMLLPALKAMHNTHTDFVEACKLAHNLTTRTN